MKTPVAYPDLSTVSTMPLIQSREFFNTVPENIRTYRAFAHFLHVLLSAPTVVHVEFEKQFGASIREQKARPSYK